MDCHVASQRVVAAVLVAENSVLSLPYWEVYSEFSNGEIKNYTSSSGLNVHPDTSAGLNIQDDTFGSPNPNNLIVVKYYPMQNSTNDSVLNLCLANVRSIKSKSAALINYITSSKADLFESTETWLTFRDVTAKLEIVSPGYCFVHRSRSNNRTSGGIGLLHKDAIKVTKIDEGEKQSFEFSEWKIEIGSFRSRLIVLYRPPYSEEHPCYHGNVSS